MHDQPAENSPVPVRKSTPWTPSPCIIALLGGLWLVLAIPSATNTSPGFFQFIGLFLFGSALGLAWIVTSLIRPALVFYMRWWIVPAAPVIAWIIFASELGLLLRVKLSDSQLEKFAQEKCRTDQHDFEDCVVGLFAVSEYESADGAVYLHTSREFMDTTGIAYLPPGCKRRYGYQITSHIYGNWYRFYWRF